MEKVVYSVDVHSCGEVRNLEAVLELSQDGKLSLRAKFTPELKHGPQYPDMRRHIFQMIMDWVEGLGSLEKED